MFWTNYRSPSQLLHKRESYFLLFLCSRSDNEVNEEITTTMPNESIKRSSVHHQKPGSSNEKVSSSRENGNVRMQEKGSPLKSGKPGRQTGSYQQAASTGKSCDRSFVSPMHLVNRHKPWLRRKTNEVEEVVKHMSSVVPHHLQCVEKGEGVKHWSFRLGAP